MPSNVVYSPSLENVLRNHEKRIERLEGFPSGCHNDEPPIVVCGEDSGEDCPPPYPVCGVCYYIIGTPGCQNDCPDDGGGEEDCRACHGEMGSEEWETSGTPLTFVPAEVEEPVLVGSP